MGVEISTRRAGDVTIMDVSGRVTLGEGASGLRNAIHSALQEGHKKILLDLGRASYIDSSGLGTMVAAYATVTNQGGELKLLNALSRVKDLLLITKLYTVFEVYEDEAAAIRSFGTVATGANP